MEHDYYVYIISNKTRSTLYIGVTNDLLGRLYEHRFGDAKNFARKYSCVHLVYHEHFGDIRYAIAREKQIKGWRREKKDALIASLNPRWEDLAADWFD